MRETERYYFRNNTLVCERKDAYNETYSYNEEALYDFKKMDTYAFDTVIVTDTSIRLKSKEKTFVIRDLEEFMHHSLFKEIPYTYKRIKKSVAKYRHDQTKGMNKQNIKRGTKIVQIGGLVFMLLAGGMAVKKGFEKSDNLDEYTITIDAEPIPVLSESEPILSDEIMRDLEEELDNTSTENNGFHGYTEKEEEVTNTAPQNAVYLNFKLTNDRVKKEYAENQFYDICREEAQNYGWSVNVPMSVLTQESAGKETNLMQIEFDEWKDSPLHIYNFTKQGYDDFVLTETPENYDANRYTIITPSDLENPRTNIKIGCALLRKSAEAMHYHILATILCYNQGIGNMEDILAYTAEVTGQEKDAILSDQTNATFVDYVYKTGVGDPEYLSHVFAFLDNDGEEITYKHFNKQDEIVQERITLFSHQQSL